MKNGLKRAMYLNIFPILNIEIPFGIRRISRVLWQATGLIIRRVWAKFLIPLILGLGLSDNQTSGQPSPSKVALKLST